MKNLVFTAAKCYYIYISFMKEEENVLSKLW